MLLEALADDRQHLLVHEAPDAVLDHLLVFAQQAAHVVQVERIERGNGGLLLRGDVGGGGHGVTPRRHMKNGARIIAQIPLSERKRPYRQHRGMASDCSLGCDNRGLRPQGRARGSAADLPSGAGASGAASLRSAVRHEAADRIHASARRRAHRLCDDGAGAGSGQGRQLAHPRRARRRIPGMDSLAAIFLRAHAPGALRRTRLRSVRLGSRRSVVRALGRGPGSGRQRAAPGQVHAARHVAGRRRRHRVRRATSRARREAAPVRRVRGRNTRAGHRSGGAPVGRTRGDHGNGMGRAQSGVPPALHHALHARGHRRAGRELQRAAAALLPAGECRAAVSRIRACGCAAPAQGAARAHPGHARAWRRARSA